MSLVLNGQPPIDHQITYNIIVSEPENDPAEIRYRINEKIISTGEEKVHETASLDTFMTFLISDISQLDDKKNQLLLYVHGMWGGNKYLFNRTVRLLHNAYIYPENSDIGRLITIKWPGNKIEYKDNKANVYKIADEISVVLLKLVRTIQLYDYLNMEFDTDVDIIAHSLGNELIKEAFNRFPSEERNYKMFDQIVMAAPDLDCSLLGEDGALANFSAIAKGVNIYFSRKDITLSISERLNDKDRLGRAGPLKEVEIPDNVCFVDVSKVHDESNLRERLMGHSYFRSSDTATKDILNALMGTHGNEKDQRSCTDEMKHIFIISSQ